MDPVLAARASAAVLGLGALGLAAMQEFASAIALGAGAVALPLAAVRVQAPPVPAGARGLAELTDALGLHGHGVHAVHNGSVRLFLPAGDGADLPALDEVLNRQTPGALGAAVTPLGQELEDAWQRTDALPDGGGHAGAAHAIRKALTGLGAARDVHVDAAGGKLRVRYRHTAHADACEAARQGPWHDRGGCPVCSLCAMLAARAHQTPVRFLRCNDEDGEIRLELEVVGSTPRPA